MPTRPSIQALPQSSSSNTHAHQQPLHHLYPLFAALTFHVLSPKIDLARVYQCIDDLGGRCVGPEQARFVITALRGRPRLSRALGEWIDAVVVVSEEWIYESYERCLSAATEDENGGIPRLPERDKYLLLRPQVELEVISCPMRKRKRRGSEEKGEQEDEGEAREDDSSEEEGDIEMYSEDVKLEDIPRLCILRPCPLTCVNQDIIDAIKPILLYREYEDRDQVNSNVLSYRRSLSMLKSVPRRIRSGKEAMKLADVGEKVASRIDEYLSTGTVAESQNILSSSRYQALNEFASVYTIGKVTAKELYDKWNCRTLEDVRKHYEFLAGEAPEVREKEKIRRRKLGGMLHVDIVEAWMGLKSELDTPDEVQEIADCAMEHLSALLDGCQYTITGGYRRGKPQSNDVDIVFCPPREGQDVGLLRDLTLRLSTVDIITHVLHTTSREAETPIHSTPNNFDNLDKAFVIFRLPGKERLHRRVDLISAPKERYAAAVLSWSGSMMFERDLRRHIERRGLKFRAGLIDPSTTTEINLPTEREIFDYVGLRYVPPELRNADG
ncbi:hypothetical protein M231_04970 [Tremella mesenterica]|uniref:DNA polymerase n=1 Tax=Tremella mesenterica TaxID=5217 RepID=A0A4Q1BJ42_TREME|nr:hypothetical protein M231_04970 [Tremella mesenterica]